MDTQNRDTDATDATVPSLNVAENLDALLEAAAAANRGTLEIMRDMEAVKFLAVYNTILLGIIIYKLARS